MRTAASYKGHPIHAMLVPFPLAFLLGAQAFDVAGVALGRPPLWTTGRHLSLAGIATALLAAASGAVDYVRSAPPESSGKQRATHHALANVGATVLFATTWLLRDPGADPGTVVLALEGAGAVLVVMGAWMGGTLVSRNQIGVDHRYATAGEWKHERLSGTAGAPVTVAGRAGARPDQAGRDRREAERGRAHRAQLGRVRGSMHPPRRLGGGRSAHLRDRAVPLGAQFDVRSGQVRRGLSAIRSRATPWKRWTARYACGCRVRSAPLRPPPPSAQPSSAQPSGGATYSLSLSLRRSARVSRRTS